VIEKKDIKKAITDRAEWRVDERPGCREGKPAEVWMVGGIGIDKGIY